MRASKPVSSIQLARPLEKYSQFKINPHFLKLKKQVSEQHGFLSFALFFSCVSSGLGFKCS